MKPIFAIHVQGGLGNMLFQIIAGECLAKKYGIEVCYPNVRQHFDFLRSFGRWVSHCDEYLTAFKNIDWFKNEDRWGEITKVEQVPFTYKEIIPRNGVKYVGYFQSEKNFFGMADYVRWLLEPADHVKKRVDKYIIEPDGACSIHVRRGNYLWHPDYHIVQTSKYYFDALNETGWHIQHFVFSDDMDWCMKTFNEDDFYFIHDTDYVELYLMARCENHIIGNSSFGWLGAYLDPNPNKIVIAPEKWFPKSPDSKDIIPESWIKL